MEDEMDEKQQILENASKVQTMIATEGWELYRKELLGKREKALREIQEAINWEDYIRKQSRLQILGELLAIPGSLLEEAAYLREEEGSADNHGEAT